MQLCLPPLHQISRSVRFGIIELLMYFKNGVGSAWVDKVVSIAGGGTGANTPSGIVASLGLGTMSVQECHCSSYYRWHYHWIEHFCYKL